MFTHDPRSAKVSKGFESTNLQGRVNSPGSSIFIERELGLREPIGFNSWVAAGCLGTGCSLKCGLDSIDLSWKGDERCAFGD
ncbi:hypothetical protein Tco_0977398 [Tanacetum coccineum]|uniref:Uncharacterized protein n=1 Tax=Tanacetum coccineum TaxID=301880 RepID=A0ABQ5EK07_9ASTR